MENQAAGVSFPFVAKGHHFGFFLGILTIVTTLPETNIAPENDPLEKEIPIGNHHFQVPC